jgi:hypothetical protein
VLRAPAERVYRAFIDADAMVKWAPPHGYAAKVHDMDARVGGGYRMSFTNFGTGQSHSFRGKYVELTLVQDGLPSAIPVEACYLGWQESLSLLAHVVEPEIPDAP